MTVLLLGANGQVGRELRRALTSARAPERVSSFRRKPESIFVSATASMDSGLRRNDGDVGSPFGKVIVATRDGMLDDGGRGEIADLAQPETLAAVLDRVQPDVIVNAAAYTAVDRAEDEPELAHRINAEAVGVLAKWAAANRALIVHYSTDYVFDGTASEPRREDDVTAPIGVYGASKLAGEQALRASGAQHILLRTAWVYAAHGHNFLKTMLRLAAERDHLEVVDDQHGTPTPAWLIADVTVAALHRWRTANATRRADFEGTFHLVAAGQTTWCRFARAILQQAVTAGLVASAPEITAITSDAFPTRARRPAWSVLDTTRLTTTFDIDLPTWQAGLVRAIAELARTRAAAP